MNIDDLKVLCKDRGIWNCGSLGGVTSYFLIGLKGALECMENFNHIYFDHCAR